MYVTPCTRRPPLLVKPTCEHRHHHHHQFHPSGHHRNEDSRLRPLAVAAVDVHDKRRHRQFPIRPQKRLRVVHRGDGPICEQVTNLQLRANLPPHALHIQDQRHPIRPDRHLIDRLPSATVHLEPRRSAALARWDTHVGGIARDLYLPHRAGLANLGERRKKNEGSSEG